MISLLITLLVVCVVIYVLRLLLPMLGLPEPVNTAVLLIVGLVALLYLLGAMGVWSGSPFSHSLR
jgi:hypothetical protein